MTFPSRRRRGHTAILGPSPSQPLRRSEPRPVLAPLDDHPFRVARGRRGVPIAVGETAPPSGNPPSGRTAA